MQSRVTRLILLLLAALSLLLPTGCDDLVLEWPLPTVVDNRIVGKWAEADGTAAEIVTRVGDGEYESLKLGVLWNRQEPKSFYLTSAGGMLFGESQVDCKGFFFVAPSESEAPKGCWVVFRVVLTGDTLEYSKFDTMKIIQGSVAGTLTYTPLRYGGSAPIGDKPISDVLLAGSVDNIASFLASYGKGAVYRYTSKMHRIS
jgi:hypothetical protein